MAVLDAALGQLAAGGYDALSFRDVARLAGVAETTVYRRWPTTHDLAADAIAHLAHTGNPMPDTGTLVGDLRVLLSQIVALLQRPDVDRILRAAAALGSSSPTAVNARMRFWRHRFEGSAEIVERAIRRDELPADTDPEMLIEFLVAPAYLRVLLLDRPLDESFVETSVRSTVAAYAVGRQKP